MSKNRYKKALVTGGAGFIGSHIAAKLLDLGLEVNVIDDLSMGKVENLPQGVRFLKGSILDSSVLKEAIGGVDVIFHNAAKVSIRNSFENVYDDVTTNVLGTINVLKEAGRSGIKKFIYASSMAVYGEKNPKPLREDSPLEPISPYGVGKLASERYTLQMGGYFGFDTVALRYFNTFGPGQTMTPYVGVITIFTTNLLKGTPPVIYGDGKQTRDFIFVEDVADANLLAMEREVSGCVINVGTGRGTTINEVSTLLIEKMAPEIAPVYGEPRQGEPGDSYADTGLSKKLLGFEPRWSLRDKLDAIIEWNRAMLQSR